MNKARMWIERSHVEHHAVREDIRHVETALLHVVGAAAKLELVKAPRRFPSARVTAEEHWDLELRRAIVGAETHPEILLLEVGEFASVDFDSGIFLHPRNRRRAGRNVLKRAKRFVVLPDAGG